MSHRHETAFVGIGGQRVSVRYTTDAPCDECDLCRAGECVQRVESCDAWGGDVVVHGRPESHEN